MQTTMNNVSIQNIIEKIQLLPEESLELVYDFIVKLNFETPQSQRACCKEDSLMKTQPLHLEDYLFDNLSAACECSTDFWNNSIDDVWNDV